MSESGEFQPFTDSDMPKYRGGFSPCKEIVKELQQTPSDELLGALHRSDISALHSNQLDRVYDLVDYAYKEQNPNSKLHSLASMYVATESIKWVASASFNKYPYRSWEEGTKFEIKERVTRAFDILDEHVLNPNKPLVDDQIIEKSLLLALLLEDAMTEVSGKERSFTGKPEHTTVLYEETGDPEKLPVIAMACIDAISHKIDRGSFTGNKNVDVHALYKAQLDYVEEKIGYTSSDGLKDVLLKRVVDSMDFKDKYSLGDLIMMSGQTEDLRLQRRLLNEAVEVVKISKNEAYKYGSSHLQQNITSNFEYLLREHPGHIKDVLGLYEQDEQDELWYDYAERIIKLCSYKGLVSKPDFDRLGDIKAAFKQIAPEEVFNHADEEINLRFS